VQTDRRRPLPGLFAAIKVGLAQYSVDAGVTAATDQGSLILDIVGFPMLNLEAVVQL
jgi:hypothetical protein